MKIGPHILDYVVDEQ